MGSFYFFWYKAKLYPAQQAQAKQTPEEDIAGKGAQITLDESAWPWHLLLLVLLYPPFIFKDVIFQLWSQWQEPARNTQSAKFAMIRWKKKQEQSRRKFARSDRTPPTSVPCVTPPCVTPPCVTPPVSHPSVSHPSVSHPSVSHPSAGKCSTPRGIMPAAVCFLMSSAVLDHWHLRGVNKFVAMEKVMKSWIKL